MEGDFQPCMVINVPESTESDTVFDPVSIVTLDGVTELMLPNNPDLLDSSEEMTGRTSDFVSPVMDEAMTSTTMGIDESEKSKSMENKPSVFGDTRWPLTLSVAPGDTIPATVTWLNSVTILISGEVRRSSSSFDCGSTWMGASGWVEGVEIGTVFSLPPALQAVIRPETMNRNTVTSHCRFVVIPLFLGVFMQL